MLIPNISRIRSLQGSLDRVFVDMLSKISPFPDACSRIEYIRSQTSMGIKSICDILDEVYGVDNDSLGLGVIPSILEEVSARIYVARDFAYLYDCNEQRDAIGQYEVMIHNEVTQVLRNLSH
jgi:hypothetical protein